MANGASSGAFGVLVTYLLSVTGRDYAVIKGMGTGALMWVVINGFIGSQMLKQKSKNAIPPILSFINHLINASLCGFLISKFGDDSLFPDTKSLKREKKLPTISMNNEKYT